MQEADALLSELEGWQSSFPEPEESMTLKGRLPSVQTPQLIFIQGIHWYFLPHLGNAEDKLKEDERKKRAFNQVTEAASELMELGYEDIYTDTREAIQASSTR